MEPQARFKRDKRDNQRGVNKGADQVQSEVSHCLRQLERDEANASTKVKPLSKKDRHIAQLAAKRRKRTEKTKGRRRRIIPGEPEPRQPSAPTAWEVEEKWLQGREQAGGIEPADWRSPFLLHCVSFLSHASERMRMSALHSLFTFLALDPLPEDDLFDQTLAGDIDSLLDQHGDDLVRALKRRIGDVDEPAQEKLVAVNILGLIFLWSVESSELLVSPEHGLLAFLRNVATKGLTDAGVEDEAQAQQAQQAKRDRRNDADNDDVRGAVVELLGVIQFVELFWTSPEFGDGDDSGDGGDEYESQDAQGKHAQEVLDAMDSVFTRLCAEEAAAAAGVRRGAISSLGLLGTLLPPSEVAQWIEENAEMLQILLQSEDSVALQLATVETLLALFAILREEEEEEEDDVRQQVEIKVGQREVYELEQSLVQLCEHASTRSRKNDDDSKELNRKAQRLLRLLHRLNGGHDEDDGEGEDEGDDDDDDEVRLYLRRASTDPKHDVMRAELVARTEWNKKRVSALYSIVGPALCIYARGSVLSDLITSIIEEEDLVISFRPMRTETDEERVYHQKKAKGSNFNKGMLDRFSFGVSSLVRHEQRRSGPKLVKDAPDAPLPDGYGSRGCTDNSHGAIVTPKYEPNVNTEQPPKPHGIAPALMNAASWPHLNHMS